MEMYVHEVQKDLQLSQSTLKIHVGVTYSRNQSLVFSFSSFFSFLFIFRSLPGDSKPWESLDEADIV